MCAVEKGHDSVVRLLLGQPGVNENGGRTALHCAALDKAPRLSIRIVIWILLSDTVFVNSIKISANTETVMLSIGGPRHMHRIVEVSLIGIIL